MQVVKFQTYDNYDAIEVGKVANIPDDYYGVMGVPITYLMEHNPNQFKILGNTDNDKDPSLITGEGGGVRIDGKIKYKRLLIQRIK